MKVESREFEQILSEAVNNSVDIQWEFPFEACEQELTITYRRRIHGVIHSSKVICIPIGREEKNLLTSLTALNMNSE